MHEQIRISKEQVKAEVNRQYDRHNKAKHQGWTVGQKVLLLHKRIRPHGDTVVTHRPFNSGPYFIADMVQGSSGIGKACKLIHVHTGKSFKQLVFGDRLKPYNNDRVDFTDRLPRLLPDRSVEPRNDSTDQDPVPSGFEPALKDLKERVKQGKRNIWFNLPTRPKHGVTRSLHCCCSNSD